MRLPLASKEKRGRVGLGKGTEPKYHVKVGVGSPETIHCKTASEPWFTETIGSGTRMRGRTEYDNGIISMRLHQKYTSHLIH